MDFYSKTIELKSYKSKGRIHLNCIIFVCYLISFFTNISIFFIFILSHYIYKWFGFLFILVELFLLRISIKKIQHLKKSNFEIFRKISYILIIILLSNCIFFLVILIYILIKKISPDLIISFIILCITWFIFHGLFISILRYYIINKKFSTNKTLFKK